MTCGASVSTMRGLDSQESAAMKTRKQRRKSVRRKAAHKNKIHKSKARNAGELKKKRNGRLGRS